MASDVMRKASFFSAAVCGADNDTVAVRGGQRQGRLLGEIRDDMLRNDQVPRSNHAMSRSNERPTVHEMSHSNERRVDGL